MLKYRLKELDIKITELANYLSISRPTMYKFIEMYDDGNKNELANSICGLFDYIEKNELIDKKNVINYILKNVATINETPSNEVDLFAEKIIKSLNGSNSESKKTIINYLINNNNLDDLFNYLIDATNSLNKSRKSKKDVAKIQSLKRIVGIYENDIKESK